MKRFILTLVTMTLIAFTASAASDMRPRHPRPMRHNHSLRYHRMFPRTCPACAFYVRHHRPHADMPPRHHAPRHHYAPAPRPPRHHARPQRHPGRAPRR